MIEINQLEQLVTIAKAGTISKAAEILLISQPALTRSIQRLEEELGLKLFDRKKNKIILNDNGELAVKYAQNVINEANEMVSQLQRYEQSKHTIIIGSCAPTPIWGLEYILDNLYPNMKITSSLTSNEDDLLNGLNNNEYLLIVLPHSIEDKQYICVELFEEYLYLSVPPAHPLALFKEISFDDLNGESVLLLSRIGFWNEICIKMIPQSHLLIQEDTDVFNEILKASALPNFKSNITIEYDTEEHNSVLIPITNNEAKATYHAIFKKKNQKLFNNLSKEFKNIDWKKAV